LKFLNAKRNKGHLVSLDARGESMDSQTFGQWVTRSSRDIYFFAWDTDGPPKGLSGLSKTLSLSPMTYSHELARVLLMEQLYRAGAALKGHPYPH
jgi:23S rRNA (pseudouridine1915-N3)-methyltransferase